MSGLRLTWVLVFLLIGSATAEDIPFVFNETSSDIITYTSDQLKKYSANSPELAGVSPVSELPDSKVIEISDSILIENAYRYYFSSFILWIE
ncbi:MAG: hypothetical protein LUQ38_00855 [Methanotrichaceae archaeon]|nr:hypothetical protein [Methanotrichaceae archaeon]